MKVSCLTRCKPGDVIIYDGLMCKVIAGYNYKENIIITKDVDSGCSLHFNGTYIKPITKIIKAK